MKYAGSEQNRTEQNRTEQNRTEQNVGRRANYAYFAYNKIHRHIQDHLLDGRNQIMVSAV